MKTESPRENVKQDLELGLEHECSGMCEIWGNCLSNPCLALAWRTWAFSKY